MKSSLRLLAVLAICTSASAQEVPDAVTAKLLGLAKDTRLEDLETLALDPQMLERRRLFAEGPRLICGSPEAGDAEIALRPIRELREAIPQFPQDILEDFQEMHRRKLLFELYGSGSWPSGCTPEYPGHHAATFRVDRNSFPAHYKREVRDSEWQELIDARVWSKDHYPDSPWMLKTVADCKLTFVYAEPERARAAGKQLGDVMTLLDTALVLMEETNRRYGCAHIEVFTGSQGEHNIHIRSKPIPGGVIGYAYFNNGTCGDHVNHVIDSTWVAGLHRVALLLIHECGHNNNLQHQFQGQSTHREPMSYNWDSPVEGFSTGDRPPFRNPRAPSWGPLSRFYSPAPVPNPNEPEPPTKPPTEPPGPKPTQFVFKVGDELTLTNGSAAAKVMVVSIDHEQGPSLSQKIAAAVQAIPEYPKKAKHVQALTIVYGAIVQSVSSGQASFEQGMQTIKALRGFVLDDDIEKWELFIEIADTVETVEALTRVLEGLTAGKALPEWVTRIITMISTMLPEGDLKQIATLILTLLEVFGAEEAENPTVERPRPIQKAQESSDMR